jgi:hypothetical protein
VLIGGAYRGASYKGTGWGGRAYHPSPARSCQPLKHSALHPGRNQDDQQHAEPARSAPLGSRATRLSGIHGSGTGGGGHFPGGHCRQYGCATRAWIPDMECNGMLLKSIASFPYIGKPY